MPDDTIVIKAPAGTKARWVRQSQRAGMKLSDWLVRAVDSPAARLAKPCSKCGAQVPSGQHCAQCGLVA